MTTPEPLSVIGAGLNKGWQAYLWLLKIIVPLSFLTMLLVYSGWMGKLETVLEPVLGVIHLPAVAALPLLVGMIAGIYAGLATMTALPLNQAEMTLIAIFLLISHNLVQEGIIQAQSGVRPLKITLIRLTASVLTVICVVPLLGVGLERSVEPVVTVTASATVTISMEQTVKQWGFDTLVLVLKLLVIILPLMVTIEAMKAYALAQKIQNGLTPLLKLLGLSPKTGLLWMVGVLFGVAFGGAIIKEEFEAGYLTPQDLERLHISIGINHSVIEDPIILMLLGLHPFWLIVPRLVAAVGAVYVLMGWQKLKLRLKAA